MIPSPPEISLALSSIPLLHDSGGSAYDELIIFGGIGLIIVALGYLSWKASKQKDKRRRNRKSKKR
jgi:small neutral amino acid transporter SnatA (MarC family)